MLTRFDFEQQIMDCWHIVDDVKILCESVLEKDLEKDQIANVLLGLEQLYQLKFEKMFLTFENLIKDAVL